VNLVEIARQPGEGDDVGLGDRPAGRAQLHADLEVFKIQAFGLIHKLSHVLLIEETEPQITQISQIKECNNL
jgi:hypothetical protein